MYKYGTFKVSFCFPSRLCCALFKIQDDYSFVIIHFSRLRGLVVWGIEDWPVANYGK
jgi:hypothetical protein